MGYLVKLHCNTCGVVWKAKMKSLDDPDPPCINIECGKMNDVRGIDFSSTRAPAAIGMSNQVRAIDATAEIVMDTYKMTDLKDDVRQGETMAPKLAPVLQATADNMFAGRKRSDILKGSAGRLARQAMAGSFRPGVGGTPDVIAQQHEAHYRPPVSIVAGDGK